MFRSPFQSPFQNPFSTEGAADEDWWLSGGISAGDCVAAYQAKGAASLAASYVNLNNPGTIDGTTSSAPSWDAVNGWGFAGLNHVFSSYTINMGTSTVIVYLSPGANMAIADTGSFSLRIAPIFNSAIYYRNFRDVSVSPALASNGTVAIAGGNVYRNGIDEGDIVTVGAPNISGVYIGNRGAGDFPYAGDIYAYALYDAVITDAQVLAVSNAMNLL